MKVLDLTGLINVITAFGDSEESIEYMYEMQRLSQTVVKNLLKIDYTAIEKETKKTDKDDIVYTYLFKDCIFKEVKNWELIIRHINGEKNYVKGFLKKKDKEFWLFTVDEEEWEKLKDTYIEANGLSIPLFYDAIKEETREKEKKEMEEKAKLQRGINIASILKKFPKGNKLYSNTLGEVYLEYIDDNEVIHVREDDGCIFAGETVYNIYQFNNQGQFNGVGDCDLFPSERQKDWSKISVDKNNPFIESFKPFQKIIVRENCYNKWRAEIFSHIEYKREEDGKYYICCIGDHVYGECLPFNEHTKKLIGTMDEFHF